MFLLKMMHFYTVDEQNIALLGDRANDTNHVQGLFAISTDDFSRIFGPSTLIPLDEGNILPSDMV